MSGAAGGAEAADWEGVDVAGGVVGGEFGRGAGFAEGLEEAVVVAGGAEGEEFGEAGGADGVCEVEVCGAGEGDFPVEVGEGVGGDEGVDYYFVGGDGGGGVLH